MNRPDASKRTHSKYSSPCKTVRVNKINGLYGLIVAYTVSINCMNCRLAHPVEQIANLFNANCTIL